MNLMDKHKSSQELKKSGIR